MARKDRGRPTLDAVHRVLADCDDRIADMLEHQTAYGEAHAAQKLPELRKRLRQFTAAHTAFLNAAYTTAEYARQVATRAWLTEGVEPGLNAPLIRFFVALRNEVDHGAPIEFGQSRHFSEARYVRPIASAVLMPGVQPVELVADPGSRRLGPAFLVYMESHLSNEIRPAFHQALLAERCEAPVSVLFLADRCRDALRLLVAQFERPGRLR